MTNIVYVGTSLDGYMADKNDGLEWLDMVPNPDGLDFGFSDFMNSIDALIMGKTTFTVVSGFDIPWPYDKPVFVVSNSLKTVPDKLKNKVELGTLSKVL